MKKNVGVAKAGSQCLTHRCFGDCKLLAQLVSPWPLYRAPAFLQGERGVQYQRFTPLHLAGGRGDRDYVYVYVRQKCTMQFQKQWHFFSLTMVALFFN